MELTTHAGRVREGSQVTVRAFGGDKRTGVVTYVDEDIKNGRSGIEYTDLRNVLPSWAAEGWAYSDQIIEIIKF